MPKKHNITVEDGEIVVAVHHEAESNEWMFLCHGFGSDKEGSYERRCSRAVKEGFNAVRFDFRGNGESDGEFIEQTLSSRIEDLLNVVDYFDPEKYVLFGSSFGGKTAFHTAIKDERVQAVIGRAPLTYNQIYADRRETVEKEGEFTHHTGKVIDHRFFNDFQQYSFEDVENEIDVPVAIFHGASDEPVPVENSFRAAANISADVMIVKFNDINHTFSDEAERIMMDQMFDWMDNVLY